MVLKIYGRNNSINVQKAVWCAAEIGLDFERIDFGGAFGGNDEDWFLALNPNGRIPVIDDDGFILWESHSIVRYLAAKYDASGLWPEDPARRGEADRWMDWQLGTLQVPFFHVFWGLVRTPEAERDDDLIHRNETELARLFGLADTHMAGREYFAGPGLSIADMPMGAAAYRWYGMDLDRPDYPNLRRYHDRLAERPAFRAHVMVPIV